MSNLFDAYVAVFFPAAIGKPDNWNFETKKIKRSTVARQNPGIDLNKDGTITVAEFKGYLIRSIPSRLKNLIFEVTALIKRNPDIAAAVVISILFFFL